LSAYVDTSVLVAALTAEASTPRVQAWLGAQPTGALLISDWVIAEFSSALSLKLRTGQLELKHRAAALAAFHRLVADSLTVLPVESGHFRAAAAYVDRHDLGLRAGDALHLAVCAEHGATLHTLDRRLHEACLAAGVASESA